MEPFIVRPMTQPLYTVNPQQSHPRLSLRRVLYVKFLRWVDNATPHALRKAVLRALTVFALLILIGAPHLFIGFVFGAVSFHHFAFVKAAAPVLAVAEWHTVVKLWKRLTLKRAAANQNTYRGIPIDALASYLFEHRKFTRDDAMNHFGITQDKHAAIATELERHQVLVRGENNARVLNDITRDELVRQLRDKFPLVWSDERKVWAERNGTFERWAMAKDHDERVERERVARLERKEERIKKRIEGMESPFSQALALTA